MHNRTTCFQKLCNAEFTINQKANENKRQKEYIAVQSTFNQVRAPDPMYSSLQLHKEERNRDMLPGDPCTSRSCHLKPKAVLSGNTKNNDRSPGGPPCPYPRFGLDYRLVDVTDLANVRCSPRRTALIDSRGGLFSCNPARERNHFVRLFVQCIVLGPQRDLSIDNGECIAKRARLSNAQTSTDCPVCTQRPVLIRQKVQF